MKKLEVPDISLCRIAILTTLALGPLGMLVSMLFLDSPRAADIASGVTGFVGGAVLAAAGLVSLALVIPKSHASSG
jgi:hypothetical protein